MGWGGDGSPKNSDWTDAGIWTLHNISHYNLGFQISAHAISHTFDDQFQPGTHVRKLL